MFAVSSLSVTHFCSKVCLSRFTSLFLEERVPQFYKIMKIIQFRNKFLVTNCESNFDRIKLKDLMNASSGKYKILCIVKRILKRTSKMKLLGQKNDQCNECVFSGWLGTHLLEAYSIRQIDIATEKQLYNKKYTKKSQK